MICIMKMNQIMLEKTKSVDLKNLKVYISVKFQVLGLGKVEMFGVCIIYQEKKSTH